MWRIGGHEAIPLLALLLVSFACKSNPVSGRNQLLYYSEESMSKLGAEAYVEMTGSKDIRISNDPVLTAPLQRVGHAIASAADKPEYEWEFKLIDDSKTVNAWCLPGGKIAFYTAIYPILQDEAGMAIVMGHEVMHAILQHGNERMSQGITAQLIMTGAAVGLSNHKYKNEIVAAIGAGATVGVILPYSRSHESEADRYGLMLAAKAGYDPEAAIGVWERMAALGGDRPPEFLSTHPDPENRIENMRAWMPEAKALYEQSIKQRNRLLPAVR
ncbi:MAG: M48 family metallopeptidase [Planctomycetes bacterium]|nr:M48 family metallopeptidase [Planctomycetota bacterium]